MDLSLDRLKLILESFHKPVEYGKSDLIRKLSELNTTNQESMSIRRMEHHLQKRILMGNNKFNTCALCGDELPNDLLVVAHIKKRADCNHLQRCDPNVVMLNYALGCDSLYEKGYVSVHEGKITENGKAIRSARISGYLSAIVNRDCTAFNDESRDYFEEHFQRHRTKPQA